MMGACKRCGNFSYICKCSFCEIVLCDCCIYKHLKLEHEKKIEKHMKLEHEKKIETPILVKPDTKS